MLTDRGLFLMDINQLLCHMWPHDPSELSLKPKSSLVSSIPVPDSRDVRFEPKEKTHGNQLPESMPSSNVTVTCNVIDENNEQGDWGIKENKRVEPVNHQCEYPESTLVQEVNPRSLTSQSCACVVDRHDHSRRPIEEGANGGGRPSFARHPTRGAREGEVTLWKEAPGEAISPDLARGSRVDPVVCRSLPWKQQHQTSSIPDVCGQKDSGTGADGRQDPQDQWGSQHEKSSACSSLQQSVAQGQEQGTNSIGTFRGRRFPTRGGIRCDRECRDDANVPLTGGTGCGCDADSNAQPRECDVRDHHPPEKPNATVDSGTERTILLAGDHDVDFPDHLEPFCTGLTERRKFQQLVRQYEDEYLAVNKQIGSYEKQSTDVLEVFCSPNSSLTTQALNQGLKAQRFTIDQGNLHSVEGRKELFQKVILSEPYHLWFSPECRPWSAWSFLNGSLSRDA